MKYVIFNPDKGYLYEDEDYLPGTRTYDHVIDDAVITFDKESDAQFNCGKGDIVVPHPNP